MFKRVVLVALLLLIPLIALTPAGGRLKRGALQLIDRLKEEKIVVKEVKVIEEKVVEKIVYKDIEEEIQGEPPPPRPLSFVPYKDVEVKDLFNEIQIRTELVTEPGGLPSIERKRKESYEAQFQLKVRVPEANDSLEELASVNPDLPKMLPSLEAMMAEAKVSPFFQQLYDIKARNVQSELTNLEKVLSRHNFYDCETMLELEHPETGQKALLIQGDMDVVADGSDGDRQTEFEAHIHGSAYFQPQTSYGWPKLTDRPNPLLAKYEKDLAAAKERYKVKGLSLSENRRLEYRIQHYPGVIADIKRRSYLVAKEDPFVVISLATRPYLKSDPYTPRIGDYAVVIYEDKIYPAICGDYGPKTKVGEASLRIAKELNDKATPNRRPISDLTVTYLIFPNTRELPFRQPNYDHWYQRCAEYLDKLGGISSEFTLHRWENRFPNADDGTNETEQSSPDQETSRVPAPGSLNLPSTPLPVPDSDGRLR